MKRHDYNLLVVEDSKLINNALCDLLNKSTKPRFNIYSSETLKEARDILQKTPVEFIILDLELPDGTGEELLGYLGSTELYIHSKVIVLTGSIDKKRRDKLFQLGIIDYLSKDNPINFLANEIKKSISQFVSHHNTHILVVDDSNFFANHIATVLRNQNYHVDTCLHSTEVYDFLKHNHVNLLITDLEMPEMNGIELLRHIRKDDQFLDLPIIGISGTSNHDLIAKLLKSGANDFLSKPFVIENLILKVDIAVSLYKKQRKLMDLNEYLEEEIERNVEDIRKKDQLLELENRHAQMGEMIGSLTHQWKQPLHAINLAAEYIKQISKNIETTQMLKTVEDQVSFLSDTMTHFRDFFKPSKSKEVFSIVQAFESVVKLLGDTYEDIDISIVGDPKICINGYQNEFYQVVINMLNNSQDAFKSNKIDDCKIDINVSLNDRDIVVSICDNAGGIPKNIIDKVFDQYISTKGSKGTGIGLHMSRSIIEKVEGSIEVENIAEGSCFIIKFPFNGSLYKFKE